MRIKLVTVGKTKEKFWQSAESEFVQRIKRYCGFTEIRIRDSSLNPQKETDAVRKQEAGRILSALDSGECVIVLDLRGRHLSSEQFAGFLDQRMLAGSSRFAFVIGGPFGLHDSVLDRADLCLALSHMTFVHEMARVFLLEQVYRAFTILKGEKYHK
jgi:23S rRNA (pseudouridine1915-N3)-methyltransferase